MREYYCMENITQPRKGRGRPADPNKRVFLHVGFRPADLETFRKWMSESGEETTLNDAVERIAEFLRTFAPGGPSVDKPRDERGWFLPAGGTSRAAQTRERRRKQREAQQRKRESTEV